MTISLSNNVARKSYAVAQSVTQTSFDVTFAFFDANDLNVYVDDQEKALNTDYTVTGGNGSTGSISISVTGATGGSTVVITRDIELKRTTDFPPSGPFAVATLNTELDKLVAISADLNDLATRAITLPDSDTTSTLTLPSVDDRKSKYLAFDTSGLISMTAGTADVTPISSTMSPIVSSDTLTLARERLFAGASGNGRYGEALLSDGSGSYFWQKPTKRRNFIVNGAMSVAKRGTVRTGLTNSNSAFTSLGDDGGYVTVDRMRHLLFNAGTYTVRQSQDAPFNFQFSYEFEVTTAVSTILSNNYARFDTFVPGYESRPWRWDNDSANAFSDKEKLTLSFYVKSSVAGRYAIWVNRFSQSIHSKFVANYTINSANTWERKVINIPVNPGTPNVYNETAALSISWYLAAGGTSSTGLLYPGTPDAGWTTFSAQGGAAGHDVNVSSTIGNKWNITGIQLEMGESATPFEHESLDDVERACSFFYERIKLDGSSVLGISTTAAAAEAIISYRPKIHTPQVSDIVLPTAGQGSGEISFRTAAGAYPSTTGSHTVTNITHDNAGGSFGGGKFNISASGYSGLTAASPSMLHSNGTSFIEINCDT